MLTLGIVAAALIGMYFSYRVDAVAKLGDAAALFHFKDHAWRSIFWVSLPPGLLFVLGSLFVTESPRWLFRRGRKGARLCGAAASRSPEQAALELEEMEATAHAAATATGEQVRDSLLRRKYVIPFLLACVILACNTATGINSVIGYNTGILLQSGLSDLASHWGYVIFTVVNFLATTIGMVLVDRKGRKFLLVMGTSGVIVAMAGVGLLFQHDGKDRRGLPRRSAGAGGAEPGADAALRPGRGEHNCSSGAGDAGSGIDSHRASLAIIYSYGDFTAATNFVRSDDAAAAPIEITRASCVPANKIEALFKNPFANLEAAQTAPLKIEKALVGSVPDAGHGWLVALGLYLLHGVLRHGAGRGGVAGAERADAHAHPLQRHEHCAGYQPDGVDHARRHLSAVREQARLLVDVLPVRGLHGGLFRSWRRSSCRRRRARRWKRLRRTLKGRRLLAPSC